MTSLRVAVLLTCCICVTKFELSQAARTKVHRVDAGAAAYTGMQFHVKIIPEGFCSSETFKGQWKKCCNGNVVKPRRGKPCVEFKEFETSGGGDPVLTGPVNGWPGLTDLKLETMKCLSGSVWSNIRKAVVDLWDPSSETLQTAWDKASTDACKQPFSVQGRIVGQDWTGTGWSQDSNGFVFYYSPNLLPRVLYGDKMLDSLPNPHQKAAQVHMFTHRYAKDENFGHWFSKVGLKDKLTWHSGVVIEWERVDDNAPFMTLVELAWVNGLGGYNGRSNWYADKLAPETKLYSSMPEEMKKPYIDTISEIRILDIEAKSVKELKEYFNKYSDKNSEDYRFMFPEFPWSGFSSEVQEDRSSRLAITKGLLNFNKADNQYSENTRNCQTFAADFYKWLTGTNEASAKTMGMKQLYNISGSIWGSNVQQFDDPA